MSAKIQQHIRKVNAKLKALGFSEEQRIEWWKEQLFKQQYQKRAG